jgi:tRNA nucleotidyltransferase/poly(A) polymerase
MLRDYIPRLKQIYEICPDKEIYLYGKCLFDIMNNKEVGTLTLLVKTKKIEDEVRAKLENTYNFSIKIDKNFDLADELFTIHCINCNVKDVITLNAVNIEGRFPALIDVNKKNIRFTEKAKATIDENPGIILDAISLASEFGYTLEISTMKNIITHRDSIKKIESRKIYHFLRDIFLKSEKPRKAISLINALGISKEIFNALLVETSIINNLNKKDIFEYFTIIFDSVPKEDLELFLTQKAGFHLRDVGQILAISKTIDMAKTSDMKIPLLSKKILDLYGVDKTMNAYRLFKALGYTELALAIKKEKNTFVSSKDMTLTLEMIMNAFIVDEKEGKKILEDAKNAVITSPELMNDSAKLLIILNKQRSKEHSHT